MHRLAQTVLIRSFFTIVFFKRSGVTNERKLPPTHRLQNSATLTPTTSLHDDVKELSKQQPPGPIDCTRREFAK